MYTRTGPAAVMTALDCLSLLLTCVLAIPAARVLSADD